MKILKLTLLFILLLSSCADVKNSSANSSISSRKSTIEPGVVITFDDNAVNEWNEVNNILRIYEWKATFCVSDFPTLSENEILKLKSLKSTGHEIAGHGLHHLNAVNYIQEHGDQAYLEKEIQPMKKVMEENGFPITSFAYPYGSRNSSVDDLLFGEFKILRGTTYGDPKPKKANCYYENKQMVLGLGIDGIYDHSSIPYFISLLEYAKKHNKIVVFYAHRPISTFESNYEVEFQTLIKICEYVKNNNMRFYTLSELHDL